MKRQFFKRQSESGTPAKSLTQNDLISTLAHGLRSLGQAVKRTVVAGSAATIKKISPRSLTEKLESFHQEFLHTKQQDKIRKLHQELDKLAQSRLKESLLCTSNINYIKQLARIHGLPPSFSSLLLNALTQSTDEVHKLKLIHIIQYAVRHDNEFICIQPLLDYLFKHFPIETIGLHDEFFSREVITQFILVILILAKHDKLSQKDISIDNLQSYQPYVIPKYKSNVTSSLESLGNWQEGINSFAPSIRFDKTKQVVKTGSQLIQSSHQKQMTTKRSMVQAHAVKTQQMETVTTEENMSQKTQMRTISLTNALDASRTKSRTVAVNQAIELNTTKQPGGSDKCFWKTTSWEVHSFLEKARLGVSISENDIKYLREKFSGFKLSFPLSDLENKEKISEIFSIISKNQVLDLQGEESSTTIYSFLEDITTRQYEKERDKARWQAYSENILRATQCHCAWNKNVTSHTKELLEKLEKVPDCTNQMKKMIWNVLSTRDDSLHDSFKFYLEELQQHLNNEEQTEEALENIGRLTVIESKCLELNAKFEFVPKLLDVVVSDNQPNTVVSLAIEIVENYLSMKHSDGLSVEDVMRLVHKYMLYDPTENARSSLRYFTNLHYREDPQSLDYAIQTAMIRCILQSINKYKDRKDGQAYLKQIPSSVWECLVDVSGSHSDRKLVVLVLASLVNLVNNEITRDSVLPKFRNIRNLIPKLFRKDRMYYDGRVELEEDLEEPDGNCNEETGGLRDYVTISEVVAKLFLVTLTRHKYNETTATKISKRMVNQHDNQTRILCSEYLFELAKSDVAFSSVILNDLQECCHDPVPDVRIYSTAAYCTTLSNLVRLENTEVLDDHLTFLASVYAKSEILLNEEDLTKWINPKIIDVLYAVRKSVTCTEELFQVLSHCLIRHANDNDADIVTTLLQIVEQICSNQAKNIPSYCIETVENLLLKSDDNMELCCRIIECCMLEGKYVSDQVLDEFHKHLSDTNRTSIPFIYRLLLASNNQDLSDQIFDDFQMELVGLRLLQTLCDSEEDSFNFLKTNGMDNGSPSDLLECLNSNLSRGRYLSCLNVHAIQECLTKNKFTDDVVKALILVSSNGQSLPKETIDFALELDSIRWVSKIRLSTALVGRNQPIPVSFLSEVYQLFLIGEVNPDEMQLIFALVHSNHVPPSHVIYSLCSLAVSDANNLTPELLSAIQRIVARKIFSHDYPLMTLCKNVFFLALKHPNAAVNEMGLRGLETLPLGELTDGQVKKIQHDAVRMELQFLPGNTSNLEFVNIDIMSESITDDEFIGILVKQLETSLEHSCKELHLNEIVIEKLRSILSTDEHQMITLTTKLFEGPVSPKWSKLHYDIVEAICFSIINTNLPGIKEVGYRAIRTACKAGLKLNLLCQEHLKFFHSTTCNVFQDETTDQASSHIDEHSNLIKLLERYIMDDPNNTLLALEISTHFKDLNSAICLKALSLIATLEPGNICTIPNVIYLITTYFQKVKPDEIGLCVQILDSRACSENENSIIHLIDAGAFLVLEALIKSNTEDNLRLEVLNMYLELAAAAENADPADRCNECVEIALQWFEKLKWQNQMTCIVLMAAKSHPHYLRFLLQLVANNPNPTIRGTAYCALLALQERVDFKPVAAEWNACTKGVIDKVYGGIYEDQAANEIKNSCSDFNLEFLLPLHSTENWDLKSLRDTAKSKWNEHIIVSDAIERFFSYENEKLEMLPTVEELLPRLFSNPATYLEIMAMFQEVHESASVPVLIQLLAEFTDDELSRLSNDVSSKQWLVQVQTVGVAKLFLNKCCNMSEGVSIKFASKLLELLENKVTVPLDIANTLPLKEPRVHFDNFIEFLKIHGSNYLTSSVRHLQALDERSRSLKELQLLMEIEVLKKEIPKTYPKYPELLSNLTNLLRHNYRCHNLEQLLPSGKKSETSKDLLGASMYFEYLDVVENLTYQLLNYEVDPRRYEQIVSQLKAKNESQWIKLCCIGILSSKFAGTNTQGQKSVSEVLTEFVAQVKNPRGTREDRIDRVKYLEKIIIQIQEGKTSSGILPTSETICNWNDSTILKWANEIRRRFRQRKLEITEEMYIEMLTVEKRAYAVWKNLHLTSIQILPLILTFETSKQGALFQVATGSGKSTIIAILAVIQALTGTKVDIYTSSPVLAERDSKEWSDFYKMFGMTCDHNGDVGSGYTRGQKVCYTKDIVYGETSQYQFDTLRDEYSGLETKAGRGYGFSIVDEVDSMFIDDSSKLARLSSTLPGMDLLQILYHAVWDRLHYIQSHLLGVGDFTYYLEGRLENGAYEFADASLNVQRIDEVDFYISQHQTNAKALEDAKIYKIDNNNELETFVCVKLKEYINLLLDGDDDGVNSSQISKLSLPGNLKAFAKSQIDNWVESAMTAVTFQENIHYIVDENLIKPVDYATTGVIQSSTNWNNGLHQFLQIKHSLKITTETVTTNFLSNMAMFKKYGSTNIVGFSGTLGCDCGKSVLEKVYRVQTIVIPELYFKRHYRLPDIVTPNEYEWQQQVVRSAISEASKGRGVLVIAQTIKNAEKSYEEILRQNNNRTSVKLYIRNGQNQEKQVERIRQGDIIIATNLAARGTDIKTPEIEEYGGMHVILTFLPESLRVEEQAFGRTSRQGNQGTSQLIIVDPLMRPSKELIEHRDEEEKSVLQNFENRQLNLIKIKDELFQKFSKCFLNEKKHLREHLIQTSAIKSSAKGALRLEKLTGLELTHLLAMEERWAIFLKRIDDNRNFLDKDYREYKKRVFKEYEDFEESVNQHSTENIAASKNCFYWIQYGNEWYRRDSKYNSNAKKAYEYYEEAINLDPNFSAAAYVGQAYVLLKGDVTNLMFAVHDEDYKTKAVGLLRIALKLLSDEISTHIFAQTLLQQRTQRSDSELFTQLTAKINLIGTYIRHIEGIISTTEKSLRKVFCTGISSNPPFELTVCLTDGKKTLPFSNFDEYNLNFQDLTFRQDSGRVDQAIDTIDKTSSYLRSLNLKLYNQNLPDVFKATDELKKAQIMLEFHAVQIDTASKILRSLKTNQFSLCVSGTPNILYKVASAQNFLGNQILIKYEDPNKSGETMVKVVKAEDVAYNGAAVISSIPRNINHCTLIIVFKENPAYDFNFVDGITVNDFSHTNDLEMFFNKFTDPVGISVEVFNPSKKAITKSWDELLQFHGRNAITFLNLSGGAAKDYIREFRKMGIEFVLCFQKLNKQAAEDVLRKADRAQEEIQQQELKELSQLYNSDCIPLDELRELAQRGIVLLATFNERGFIPWRSVIAVGILGSVQIAAGAALIVTGFGATVGMGLITEGMADYTIAGMAAASRNFDWTSYAKQKAVSVTISCVSMGLSKLKDGAKGVKSLAQGILTEVGEQTGTQLFLNGKTVSQTIQVTAKNLRTLAFKQIGVQAGENVARAGLNALVSSVAQFSFEQLQPAIANSVNSSFKLYFNREGLQQQFRQFYGVHSVVRSENSVANMVMKWIIEMTNPQSSYWSKQWDSVGSPLCQNILSDPNYLYSPFSLLTRAAGVVNGMREIATIVSKVCTELEKRLTKANESKTVQNLLQCQFSLTSAKAEALTKLIKFEYPRGFDVQKYPTEEELDPFKENLNEFKLKAFFEKIGKSINNYNPNTLELSQLRQSIVNAITSNIIHTADRQLISPISTFAVGSIVKHISQEIQSRMIVSEEHYTPEQQEDKNKAQQLQAKPQDQLTAEEQNFLQKYRPPTTIREQILTNAFAHNVAFQQREIIIEAQNQFHAENLTDTEKLSKSTLNDVINIASDGPPDLGTMTILSKLNNLNIKIVDNPDYQPTQEDLDAGVEIIVMYKLAGSNVDTYLYKDKETGELKDFSGPAGAANSGYSIFENLTGKTASELRCDVAKFVLTHPKLREIMEDSRRWLESRFPVQANGSFDIENMNKEEFGFAGVASGVGYMSVGPENQNLISRINASFRLTGSQGVLPVNPNINPLPNSNFNESQNFPTNPNQNITSNQNFTGQNQNSTMDQNQNSATDQNGISAASPNQNSNYNSNEGSSDSQSSILIVHNNFTSKMSKKIEDGDCYFIFAEAGSTEGVVVYLGDCLVEGNFFGDVDSSGGGNNMVVMTSFCHRRYIVELEEPLRKFLETIENRFPDTKGTYTFKGRARSFGKLNAVNKQTGETIACVSICSSFQVELAYHSDPKASLEQIQEEQAMFDDAFAHLEGGSCGFSTLLNNIIVPSPTGN